LRQGVGPGESGEKYPHDRWIDPQLSGNPTAAAQPAVTVRRSRRRIGILALLAIGTMINYWPAAQECRCAAGSGAR
jgi:hypothetical protein